MIGALSDHFAESAAVADHQRLEGLHGEALQKLIEPYRPDGLRAMYVLPLATLLLSGSLFAASRTVGRDMQSLQDWMRESSVAVTPKPVREKVTT